MTPGNVIGACWVLFILYWIINARWTKPVAETPDWVVIWAYRVPIMIGGMMLWAAWHFKWLRNFVFPWSETLAWLGAGFCAAGLAGAIWSRRTLAGNWSSDVLFRQGHELIERGPYRFVRHPIYTSILMMCLGSAIAQDRAGPYVGLVFIFAGFWIKLRQEETLLTRHFPEEYPTYMKRVKALIPFIV